MSDNKPKDKPIKPSPPNNTIERSDKPIIPISKDNK